MMQIAETSVAMPGTKIKRLATFAISLLVSAACLYAAFRNIQVEELVHSFLSISVEWLALAWVFQILTLFLRARRWQAMFVEKVSYRRVYWTIAIGFLVNNILPLRLGDFARIFLLRLMTRISSFRIGFTVLIERFLDVAGVLVAFAFVAYLINVPGDLTQAAGALLAIIVVALIGSILFYLFARRYMDRIPVVVVQRFLREFVSTAQSMTLGRLAGFLILTILFVAASTAMTWAVLKAFNPDATWLAALMMTVAVSLAMALPSAPGQFGVFQFAGQISLVVVFGDEYDPATALAAAFVLHAIFYVSTTVIGIAGIWSVKRAEDDGLTVKQILASLSGSWSRGGPAGP